MEPSTPFELCVHIIPELLELLALALCIGTLVCRLWVIPEPAEEEEAGHRELSEHTRRLLAGTTALMVVTSIADIAVRSAELSGKPFSEVFTVLPIVVLETHLGKVWLIHIISLGVLAVMANGKSRHGNSRIFLRLMLCVGLIASITRSATGHAADAGDFSIPEVMDSLHLLAVLVWGGGVFFLALVAHPHALRAGERTMPLLGRIVCRFSLFAGFAVGAIAITATYNVVTYVSSLDALLRSPYGMLVLTKTILFFLLIILGAINRYALVPALCEVTELPAPHLRSMGRLASRTLAPFAGKTEHYQPTKPLQTSMRLEALLITGLLVCSTLLRHEVPARHALHMHGAAAGHEHYHHSNTTGSEAP